MYPIFELSISLGNAFFTSRGVSVKNSCDYNQRILSRQEDNFECSVYRRLGNAVVFEVHESPSLENFRIETVKSGSTAQASLTCSASWTMSGLLKSISGIDIATAVLFEDGVLLQNKVCRRSEWLLSRRSVIAGRTAD